MRKTRPAKNRTQDLNFDTLKQARSGQEHMRDELKRSQERYRTLVEQSNEGIWLCEIDAPIDTRLPVETQIEAMLAGAYLADCNDAMARMYGYAEREALIGTRLSQLFVPENDGNRLFLRAFIENSYRLSEVESVEKNKDGTIVHFRNNLIGIVRDHSLICAWGMQKDITQEVGVREGLRRSEERLRMASEAGRVGIWEWNILTNELFWSDRVKHLFEFPLDQEVTMDDFRSRIHPDDREQMAQRIAKAMDVNTAGNYVSEHRVLASGALKWVLGFGETYFDPTGKPIRMVGTVIDVTETKLAEAKAIQLRDAGSLLSQAMTPDELFHIVQEFAVKILGATEVTLHGREATPAVLRLIGGYGLDAERSATLQIIPADSRHPIAQAGFAGAELFTEGPSAVAAIPLQLNQRILGAIGLRFSKSPTFDKDFQRFVLTFADQCAQTFERTQLYERERSARREAEAANQAKSRFLANMSHEIRTPLGAIIGFAELLNEEGVTADERTDCINRILRNGHLLADMINDILDLSKIESEKIEIEHIDFPLIPLVEEVLSLLRLKAQERHLRLSLASVGILPEIVHSDPTRLQQILINLIGNAIKFTEKGGVEIRLAAEGAQLRFTITDTGIGIPEAQQSRIFEPFMQADSSTTRRFGGTGLGLAVSRGLSQALGGDLQLVKSVSGEGSIFSFTIDIGHSADSPISLIDPTLMRKNQMPHELAGLRILVVDDNSDNRTYIGSFLTSAGAQIAMAANGLQAVNMAVQNEYDIVLMDIQMPELDGFGAMRELRSQQYAKPVLALTAHAMTGDRENSLSAGFQDHLVKPIDRSSLIQAIKRFTLR